MTQILRQSTAVDVLIGPFVDATNGKTAEAGLTIAQANVRLSKNAQNIAQKNDSTTCVYDEVGMYNCELDATDTDTIGTLDLIVDDSAALTVVNRFQVLAPNAYDAVYGADSNILTARDVGQHLQDAILTVTSQTQFIMTNAITHDDQYNNLVCTIEDVSTNTAVTRYVTDVVSSTKTITIDSACPFTVVAGDIVRVESRPSATQAAAALATSAQVTAAANDVIADVLATAQVLARSDAANATDNSAKIAEINTDNGSGAGAYTPTTDSIEAVGTQTDQMVFTVANQLDVNVLSTNDIEIKGSGIPTTDPFLGIGAP